MTLDEVNALKVGDAVLYRPRPFASPVPGVVVGPKTPVAIKRRGKVALVEWFDIQSLAPQPA